MPPKTHFHDLPLRKVSPPPACPFNLRGLALGQGASPLDWWCRRFIEGHADHEAFNCLRIPDPRPQPKLTERVVQLAGRLAAVDDRFATWAQAVGVPCGPLDAAVKQDHIHELAAVVAHLYSLSERQLVHIFKTFHDGWDYADRLEATLKHFQAWAKKLD